MKPEVYLPNKGFWVGQSYLTGGAVEGLRVIQLLPSQHHLSNFMSMITSSLNTQTHSAHCVRRQKTGEENGVLSIRSTYSCGVDISYILYAKNPARKNRLEQ